MVTPLAPELAPARPVLGDGEPIAAPGVARLWQTDRSGRAVVFGWTGVGGRATEACFAHLAELRPERVLHIGCAGALRDGLAPGDTFRIERAHHGNQTQVAGGDPALDAALAHLSAGETVSVSAVASPAEKEALAKRHPQAGVVEMETYWALEAAHHHALALTCVRVVLDPLDHPIPDLGRALDAAGQVRPAALARHLLRRPGDALALARVGACMNRVKPRIRDVVAAALRAVP